MGNQLNSNKIWIYNIFHSEKSVIFLIVLLLFWGLTLKILFIFSLSPIRGVESNVLFSIQELMAGDQLYPDPDKPPFSITQYTPLYYILIAAISKSFNIVPGVGFEQIIIVGRAFSVILSIGIGVIVFLICKDYGAGQYLAALSFTFAFLLPIPWYSLLRPDALMGFFGILTIVLYSFYLQKQDTKNNQLILVMVGATGFLSFLAKQNGAIFIVAVILYGVIRFRIKDMAYISLGSIFTILISSIIFSSYYKILPSETNYFYDHIIGGLNNGIDLIVAYQKLYSIMFSWYFPLIAFPFAGILLLLRQIVKTGVRKIDDVTAFLALAYFVVLTSNLIAGIKDGSAIHYINESLIIGILLIVRLIKTNKSFVAMELNIDHKIVLYSFIFLYLFFSLFHQTISYRDELRNTHLFRESEISKHKDLIDYMENELSGNPDALVYSEYSFFNNYYFDHIIVPQREIATLNWMLDIRDYSEISNITKSGELRYIVVGRNSMLPKSIVGIEITEFELVHLSKDVKVFQNTRSP